MRLQVEFIKKKGIRWPRFYELLSKVARIPPVGVGGPSPNYVVIAKVAKKYLPPRKQ